ncbi:MAG: hypothetical protein LBG24_09875 [Treponema sp.]|jgi:hypothetical protein|nr:hypothetical protein [Treponema sp.]
MKKKHVALWIWGMALIGSLWFTACPTDSDDSQGTTYSVTTVADPGNGGTFSVSPQSGPADTVVTVTITSNPDFYLDEVWVDNGSKGKTNPVTFTLIDHDVTVKAVFKDLPANNYKVILKQPEGGTISFSISGAGGKEYGPKDSTVTLSNQADSGYVFKEYTAMDADGGPITITGNTFTLPAKHVTLSGVFEKLADKSETELLTAGKNALKAGEISVAINAYEAAYAKNNDNAEALVYSTLGKLASIAWSKEAGDFFKNHLGLTYYPNTLDALIDPESWFTYYPDGDGTVGQPPLNTPEWVKDKTPYTKSLVSSGSEQVASSATWSILLMANLIDKNATGLNPALDAFIKGVFENPNFTEAEKRTASLKAKDPVLLDGDIADRFGLSGFFGKDQVYVGWAELELLLSALKLVKATLLYVDSYNWTYDINFVKDLPWDETILEDEQIDAIAGKLNQILPFRTSFMTARSGSYIEDSRKTYIEAIQGIIGVYDYYIGDTSKLPNGFKNTLKEYESYKDEVAKAKDAIDKKESYTVPKELGNITINFGKFFTPGQLALDQLIETDNSKSPVFYSSVSSPPKKITTFDELGDVGVGFKIITTPIADIIGKELTDNLLQGSGLIDTDGYLFLDPVSGKIAWAVYHWDEDISAQVKKWLSDEAALSVAKLP